MHDLPRAIKWSQCLLSETDKWICPPRGRWFRKIGRLRHIWESEDRLSTWCVLVRPRWSISLLVLISQTPWIPMRPYPKSDLVQKAESRVQVRLCRAVWRNKELFRYAYRKTSQRWTHHLWCDQPNHLRSWEAYSVRASLCKIYEVATTYEPKNFVLWTCSEDKSRKADELLAETQRVWESWNRDYRWSLASKTIWLLRV